jgi:hypothetical protein
MGMVRGKVRYLRISQNWRRHQDVLEAEKVPVRGERTLWDTQSNFLNLEEKYKDTAHFIVLLSLGSRHIRPNLAAAQCAKHKESLSLAFQNYSWLL